jgi:hypothetical protein
MANLQEIDWIVEKASELLEDKVKDGPISEKDVQLAFEIFARPRLSRLSFESGYEARQTEDKILVKLNERAKQLNSEHW